MTIYQPAQQSLRDVTFLIPIRIDSQSRLDNLLITTRYLHQHFDSSILIYEADEISRIPVNDLPASCRHIFEYDANPAFHRTRINNYLIDLATTPIVSLYDADIILPAIQIIDAVTLIRNGKADFVAPFDGRFYMVDEKFKATFAQSPDIQLFLDNNTKFSCGTKRSWGGALFTGKAAFTAAGKENENFGSWGPEDIERVKRMKHLGYRVKRIEGPLFHLYHEIKQNSSYTSPDEYIRYMEEYIRICNMTTGELMSHMHLPQQA